MAERTSTLLVPELQAHGRTADIDRMVPASLDAPLPETAAG
jgi:hypothetical protein